MNTPVMLNEHECMILKFHGLLSASSMVDPFALEESFLFWLLVQWDKGHTNSHKTKMFYLRLSVLHSLQLLFVK
jgi:hypothetical protein